MIGALHDSFRSAYGWMAAKMTHAGIRPLFAGTRYPIWAWYQWEGCRKRRDMRQSGYAEKGTKIVRLTLEIADNEVLLSDFDLFHYVLNRWHLPRDEKDGTDFEKAYKNAGYAWNDLQNSAIRSKDMLSLRERIVKSWDRIFDLEHEDEGWLYGKNEHKSIQAAFWQMKMDQLLKAEAFVAR